ncbi:MULTISPECIES: abortive infection family protein [Vibrio]|uniref:abortive infection family protein n=1 Tax=Vibrio harveyi group TaxID=717610 RepID=UPI00084ADC70|nr:MULTISPECIES: abortive infection family protein [Vibrio harveyi group]MBE3892223.1 abortive infection family protein [Vibrio parahaemolyticus]MBE3940515.1 abortive infection family protein [Vibrio parahaemolyticus]MBE3990961.1 abortive infection family protein [Vibrio parahaemolyticus]MBM5007800.1 abortive infection family protein [Vibrio parahaemolyticus]MCQ9080228.1 abortive infection family protein [Vibrio parahaemolyticus]
MSNDTFRLRLSTRAIAETDTATHLIEQKERLESAIQDGDSSLSIDLSKAFLESIFKTIIADREETPQFKKEFFPLFRQVKDHLLLSDNQHIADKLSNLAGSIINTTGELRNQYGAASHGDDGYYQSPLKMTDVEFVISAVDGLAAFLYTKHRETLEPDSHHRILYEDYPEFNDWLDGQYDGYSLYLSEKTVIEYSASQMIFTQDPSAYREMLIQYTSTEDDDE